MPVEFTTSYLTDSLGVFRTYKKMAERAMDQVSDEQLFAALDGEMNSIAIIVKHMVGNMRSRWTDFLTDGEADHKGQRIRRIRRRRAQRCWVVGRRLEIRLRRDRAATDADLGRTVTIRGEAHSVMQAINRQVAHYANHRADYSIDGFAGSGGLR
jgi:hypothetical protein